MALPITRAAHSGTAMAGDRRHDSTDDRHGGAGGAIDRDADGYRQHIGGRGRDTAEAQQLNVEGGVGGPHRLGAERSDVVDAGRP